MPNAVNLTVSSRRPTRPLDVASCRSKFPALSRRADGVVAAYFDGPAGSQVPASVADAMSRYLLGSNANHGGVFATSRESDALLDAAHQAAADFFGVADPAEIAFGPNMTTLTFALSRALSRTWRPGDEVLVTQLDHDANVTPWTLAARDVGAIVKRIAIRRDDCTLDLDSLRAQLSPRTRLVAVGCASNAVGTINPVAEIVRQAKAAGALTYLDAVHWAPHRRIEAAAWGADFVVSSAYKFFGPHVGLLWGRRELLESLPAYKLRPATDELPGKWMTGTQSHEGIAGVLAAIEYLEELGRTTSGTALERAPALDAAFAAIADHERALGEQMLDGLARLPKLKLWGVADRSRLNERVATFGLTHSDLTPREMAVRLDRLGMFAWHGNFYALPLTETLGLEPAGLLRIGFLHYNTSEEVERLLAALAEM